MSLDLDKIEALAFAAHQTGKAVPSAYEEDRPYPDSEVAVLEHCAAASPAAVLEMIALIRRQEKELIEARERRSEPSAVRVTIVDERASRLPIVPASEPLPPHAALIDHGATLRMHMPVKYGSPVQDKRRQGRELDMVDHRLRQILNPPAPFHGEKWAAADALYWLTGDQAFADQADGLAAESLARRANCQNYPGTLLPDVVVELREYASNSGYSHGDYADTMKRAAHVIESLRAMMFHVAAQTDTDKGGKNFCHLIDELILSWNTSEPDTEALRQRRIDARATLEVAIERGKP